MLKDRAGAFCINSMAAAASAFAASTLRSWSLMAARRASIFRGLPERDIAATTTTTRMRRRRMKKTRMISTRMNEENNTRGSFDNFEGGTRIWVK